MKDGKNGWICLILILAGVVLGGFLGKAASGISFLSWLNYGQSFGFASPIVLDLGVVVLTFGLTVSITIAGIIGILIAVLIYNLM